MTGHSDNTAAAATVAQRQAIERDRESLERDRQELERLRREIEAQRATLQQQQQRLRAEIPQHGNIQDQQRAVNTEEITTIISNVQNFQIDIKMPKFKDDYERNPIEFLEEMKRFFKAKNVKQEKKMTIVEHALEGRASLWMDLQNNIENYDQFKVRFLEEFYSVPIRVQFKNAWLERRYNAQKESLQTYYYRQVKDARYFRPELTEYEVNYNIIQQYPAWIKERLVTVDYNNSALIGQTLGSLDGIRRTKERESDCRFVNNTANSRNGAPRLR